ncbi:MAG: hypothetical protein R3C58_04330 [Parvularculaceae bacterium]
MPFLVFIAFFLLGLALRQGALMDPDAGWHIAAGDLIRETGAAPEADPWSYSAPGSQWYDISWAYDVVLSLLHGWGGLAAVVVFSIALYALAVAITGAIALRASGSLVAATIATALIGFVLLPGMLARPHVASFLFILAFYWLLRWGAPRLLWALPVLMACWANIHGGFLAAFVIIGAFFLEALAVKDIHRCMRLAVIGALCAVAIFVNPYGVHIIDAVRLTMNSAMRDVLMEWRPLELNELSPATVFIALAALVSALHVRSIPLADKILACFWIVMGVSSVRMMQIAALLSAPYLAQALALRLRGAPFGAALMRRELGYMHDLARPAVTAALAVVCGVFASAGFIAPVQRAAAGGEAFVSFPAHIAVDGAIDAAMTRYDGARLYAGYGLGGYLIYRERGRLLVFADGRADTAYPRAVLEDAIVIGVMDPRRSIDAAYEADWRARVTAQGIEGFLIARGGRLEAFLTRAGDWAPVYEDNDAALYMRRDLAARG